MLGSFFFFFFQITKRGSIFLGLNTRYFQRSEEPVVQFPPFFSRSQVFWKRNMYFPLSRLLPQPPHVPAPWWDFCWRTHQITASHFSEEPEEASLESLRKSQHLQNNISSPPASACLFHVVANDLYFFGGLFFMIALLLLNSFSACFCMIHPSPMSSEGNGMVFVQASALLISGFS